MTSPCIISLFLATMLVAASSVPAQPQIPKRTLLLEIRDTPQELLHRMLPSITDPPEDPVLSYVRGTALVLATHAEAAVLKERGVHYAVIMEDTSRLTLTRRGHYGPAMTMPGAYHTYERIVAEADALEKAHPDLIQRIPIGRTSKDRREIYAYQLGSSVREKRDVPALMFTGCHHADEVMGAEICMALMHRLVDQCGEDATITGWMRDFAIYIIPVLNVDGHTIVTHSIDPEWRKNGRGVDINRNYDFNWAHGGSDDPVSDRYRGPYPFSEAENRAMRDFLKERKVLLSITYHSQGEVIYYPWTWAGRPAPDDKLLGEIARGLAGSIRTMKGDTTYKAEYGAGTVGQSYTWLYGTQGTFDFVIETGSGAHIFPEAEIGGIVKNNLDGVRYLFERGRGPGLTGHVMDARTGKPLEATVWFPEIETEDTRRRTTEGTSGKYWRLLAPGKYSLIVSAPGHRVGIFKDVAVGAEGWTKLEVKLEAGEDMN